MSVQCFCGSWDHEPWQHPDDPRAAALAEALDEVHGDPSDFSWNPAATLAALAAAGWMLIRVENTRPLDIIREQDATIARLRRIEEAARAYLSRPSSPALLAALRAALEEK